MKKSMQRALVTLVLLLFNVPFPVRFTQNAIELSLDDPEVEIKRELTVSGWYHLNLFKADSFIGTIAAEGYEMTNQPFDELVYCRKSNSSRIVYNSEAEEIHFGIFWADRFLRHIIVGIKEQHTNGASTFSFHTGRYIVGGVYDRASAVDQLRPISIISLS